jgi:hypothetical protein
MKSRRQETELTQFPNTLHTRQRLLGSLIGSGALRRGGLLLARLTTRRSPARFRYRLTFRI